MSRPLSDEAKHILVAMSHGKLLRIGRDERGALLVDPPTRVCLSVVQIPVSSRVVFQLQQSAAILRVRSPGALALLGVKDAEEADYWVCNQQGVSTGTSAPQGSGSV